MSVQLPLLLPEPDELLLEPLFEPESRLVEVHVPLLFSL